MKISIIVPVYKGQKYIDNLIHMAEENQTHLNKKDDQVELVLVNDFPTKALILPENRNQIEVKVYENPQNAGIHQSKVNGLNVAEGDYILFLDQDDKIDDHYMEEQIPFLNDSDAVICNGFYHNGEVFFTKTNPMKDSYTKDDYFKGGYPLLSLGQLLIKKNEIPKYWMENVMMCNGWDDHFLWASLIFSRKRIVSHDKKLYNHIEDGNNTSFDWMVMYRSGEEYKKIFLGSAFLSNMEQEKFCEMIDAKLNKYLQYHEIDQLFQQTTSKKVEKALASKDISQLAIYGMGVYGKKLLDILETTNIEVQYAIDQRNDVKNEEIPVYSLQDDLGEVDAVIVTPIFAYESIQKVLKNKFDCPCISMKEILNGSF